MYNGIVCPHIIAYTEGYSRDNARQLAQQIGGRFCVVLNDAQLAKELEDKGFRVIFRVLNDLFDDDNLHQHISDGGVYVQYAFNLLVAAGVKDKIVYWNNEPGNQDLAVLKTRLRQAILKAKELGCLLVVLNIAYRNWSISDWDYLDDELALIVRYGFVVGVHEGYHKDFPDLASAVPETIGRFRESMHKYGFKVIVTEFAASYGAHDGWRKWLTVTQWLSLLRDAVREVYAPLGVPVCVFSAYPWKRDFDYYGEEVLKNGMADINRQYPIKENAPVAEKVNIVDYAFPFPQGEVYKLSSGETCQSVWQNLIAHLRKNTQWEEAWVEEVDGVRWLMRGMDISNFLSNQKTVYALFRDQALTRYGGKWVPETAEVGKVYERKVWVQVFNATNGDKIAVGSDWDTTYFKVVKRHATWTTPEANNPVVQQDVIECVYGHDKAAIEKAASSPGTGVAERYFYSKGFGLVGFIDPHLNIFITHEKPPASLNEIVLSWWVRPTVKSVQPGEKPMPAPIPTSSGKTIQITKLPGTTTFRNIRADADANAADIGDMKIGDILTAFVDAPNNGFVYVVRSDVKGWVSWLGVEFKETSTPVPPVSQEVIYTEAEHAALLAAIRTTEADLAIVKSRLKGAPSDSGGTF